MKTKQIIISLDIETDKDYEEIIKALKKGIYVGLDSSPNYIAQPKDVKINYCLPR